MAAAGSFVSTPSAGRARARAAALVLTVFAASAATGYAGYMRFAVAPPTPVSSGTPARVERGSVLATVSATGSVIATRQSKLTLPTGAGRLTELPIRLGDAVKADDVLARTDPAPLEMKLGQAESTLRTALV